MHFASIPSASRFLLAAGEPFRFPFFVGGGRGIARPFGTFRNVRARIARKSFEILVHGVSPVFFFQFADGNDVKLDHLSIPQIYVNIVTTTADTKAVINRM